MESNNKRINKAYRLFFEAMLNVSIDLAVKAAYELLNFPVLVNDEIANNISHAPSHEIGDPDWDYLIKNGKSINHHFLNFYKKYLNHPGNHKYPMLINDGYEEKKHQLISVLTRNNQISGYSSVIIGDNTLSEDDLLIIDIFNSTITSILSSQEKKHTLTNMQSIKILTDMISNSDELLTNSYNIIANLTVRYPRDYLLFISEFININYDKPLYTQICNEIMKVSMDILAFIYKNQIIILFSNLNNNTYYLNKKKSPINEVINILKKFKIHIGISSQFKDLIKLNHYYQQALLTLKTGIRTSQKEFFFDFEVQMPLQIFNAAISNFPSDIFINPVITEIYFYDKENNTHYLQTLGTYLLCMMNSKKASEKLFIHINTVTYRIKRISELFSIDFNNQRLINILFCNFYMIKTKNISLE